MSKNTTKGLRLLVGALFVALVAALVVTVAGGDDTASAEGVDRAFTAEMVPHHESAVDMAEVALLRTKRPEIRGLAEDIIRTQNDEIAQMRALDQRLADDGAAKGSLGMDDSMIGMDMDATALDDAEPFDRAFIDMMIPHHQGAIRMARMQLDQGTDAETRRLAEAIIAAQSKEIEQMNAWRKEWYGETSPAGGVPAAGDGSSGDHSGMDMG